MRSDFDPAIGGRSGERGEPSSMGGTAAKAREGAEQLKNKALERVGDAREKAYSQRESAADRVRRVSSAVRSAGDRLREEDDSIARFADKASERIDRAADYLATAEPQQVVRDVEDFARRQPAVFFGGAFLLGLAAARFIKSSQPESGGYERERRFAGSYAAEGEVQPASERLDIAAAPEHAGMAPGPEPIPVTPQIDVGGFPSGNDGVSAPGQGGWPERKG